MQIQTFSKKNFSNPRKIPTFAAAKNKNMEPTRAFPQNFIKRFLADKKAIKECISKKGDLNRLAEERGFKFAANNSFS